jgi:hypothetical protein
MLAIAITRRSSAGVAVTVVVGVPSLPHISLFLYRASEDGSFARFGNGLEVQERALAFFFFFLSFFIQLKILSFINWDDAEIFILFCQTTI